MGRTPSHSSSALTKKTTSTASAHKTSSTEKGSSKPAPSVKRSEFLADVALAFIEKNDDIGMALCGEAHFTKGGAGPTQIQCMSKIAKTVSKDNDEYGLLWDDHDERKVLVESTSSWWKRTSRKFKSTTDKLMDLGIGIIFGVTREELSLLHDEQLKREGQKLIDATPYYWRMLELHRTHDPASWLIIATNSATIHHHLESELDPLRHRRRTISRISPHLGASSSIKERDDRARHHSSTRNQEKPTTIRSISKNAVKTKSKKKKIPLGATSPLSGASSSMEEAESSDVSSSSPSISPAPSAAGLRRQERIDFDALKMEHLQEIHKMRLEHGRLALEERTKRARAEGELERLKLRLEHRELRITELEHERFAREERKGVYPLYMRARSEGIEEALQGFQYWFQDYKAAGQQVSGQRTSENINASLAYAP